MNDSEKSEEKKFKKKPRLWEARKKLNVFYQPKPNLIT